jgi:serine/threonine protein kinase
MNSEQLLTESQADRSASDHELTEALETYLQRLESGESPDAEQLLHQHPGIADRLRSCLESLQLVEHAAGELSKPTLVEGIPHCDRALGDFRLVREIGRGGMGVVYEAEQVSLGRHVAVKVLPFAAILDDRHLRRFKNEAHAAALLKHPNIVSVYGVGCERGVHYFAMELIDGWSLAEAIRHLQRSGEGARDDKTSAYAETTPIASLSTEYSQRSHEYFRSVAQLGVQVAEALDYAHREGVIHRDIKPSNLLLGARGDLWISDFGLAQIQSDHNLTMTGDLVGTLRYMSPEQAAGRKLLDHRTDIYSLGVTLYELLTLRPAFPSEQRQELLRQVIESQPRPPRSINGGVPKDLETIVLKAISREPESRYDTAAELAEDLQRFLDQKPIQARRSGPIQQVWRWGKRNPTLASCITALAVLLILVAVAGWTMAVRQSKLLVEKSVLVAEKDEARKEAERDRRNAQTVLGRALNQTYRAMAAMDPEQLGLLDDAVAYYETLLEDRPDDPEIRFEVASAFVRLGAVHYFCGSPEKSQALAERVIELVRPLFRDNPMETRYRLLLAAGHGNLCTQRELPPDLALEHIRRAIDLMQPLEEDKSTAPRDLRSLAFNRVGYGEMLMERAGQYKEAERQLRKAVGLWQRLCDVSDGEFADVAGLAWARFKLARLLRESNRFREAEHNMRLAHKPIDSIADQFWLQPEYASGRVSLLVGYAQLMLCMQRPKEAARWARSAIVVAEGLLNDASNFRWGIRTWARANRVLSDALMCLDQNDEAERAGRSAAEARERMVEAVPSSAEYKISLAWSQYRLGERLWWIGRRGEADAFFQQSRDRLEQAITQHSEERGIGRCLARVLIVCPAASLRDPDRGLELALADVQPEVGATWQLLGAAYYRSGRWQQAIEALTKSIELNAGGDGTDWILLAMAYWRLEETTEALHWYREAHDAFCNKSPLGLQNFSHPFHLRDLLHEAESLLHIDTPAERLERDTPLDDVVQRNDTS